MTPPSNITLSKDKKLLTVSFKDDHYALTSEFLRVLSPSAEVRGHGPGQETLQLWTYYWNLLLELFTSFGS